MDPLVSIIIPTYNRAHIIGETLDSILAQSYNNWECIVVDDGSSDTTVTILQNYCKKEPRIRFEHRSESHLPGGNGARNYGLELAKGDYIQWFDSDDLMHPDSIKTRILLAHVNNADVIVAAHCTDGNWLMEEKDEVICFQSDTFYLNFLMGEKQIITNDLMVRKEKLGELQFDEILNKAQEFEFFSRLFEQKLKYCFTNATLSFHRITNDNLTEKISTGGRKQQTSLIYLSKLLMKRHQQHPLVLARMERQGRKTYKTLINMGELDLIIKNYSFFQKCHHRSFPMFTFYFLYNVLTKRGFDKIKSTIKT